MIWDLEIAWGLKRDSNRGSLGEKTRKERKYGGERRWKTLTVLSIAQCPREGCGGGEAFFYQVQIRSADEPMTTFYKVMGQVTTGDYKNLMGISVRVVGKDGRRTK